MAQSAAKHCLRNPLDYLPRKADDDSWQELRWVYDRQRRARSASGLSGLATVASQKPEVDQHAEAADGRDQAAYVGGPHLS